jgi:hypothetical protein
MGNPPVSPAAQKSRTLWWILGGLGAVCVVLVVLALVVGFYFAHHMRVKEEGNRVAISTPAGEITVRHAERANPTGLPVYPGATAAKPGETVEFEPHDEEEAARIAAARYFTSDALEKVQAWYANHLGPEFTLRKRGHLGTILGWHAHDADVAFVAETEDRARVVALKRSGGEVKITLVGAGKREPQ